MSDNEKAQGPELTEKEKEIADLRMSITRGVLFNIGPGSAVIGNPEIQEKSENAWIASGQLSAPMPFRSEFHKEAARLMGYLAAVIDAQGGDTYPLDTFEREVEETLMRAYRVGLKVRKENGWDGTI